jgi:hypothetical protein
MFCKNLDIVESEGDLIVYNFLKIIKNPKSIEAFPCRNYAPTGRLHTIKQGI